MPVPKDPIKYAEYCALLSANAGRWNKGKKLTEEHKANLRKAKIGYIPWNKGLVGAQKGKRGEKSNFWKGGTTLKNCGERKVIQNTPEYRLWRKSVFKRDDYTCQICNARNKEGLKLVINADHIKPFSLFPELRFDINNGRTLCSGCHRKTDTYGGNISKYRAE